MSKKDQIPPIKIEKMRKDYLVFGTYSAVARKYGITNNKARLLVMDTKVLGVELRSTKDRNRRKDIARSLINSKRGHAKARGVEFSITKEDITPLPEFCPVLGIKLDYFAKGYRHDASAGIDRINPLLGYVKGNVAVVSVRANRIKNNATVEEMEKILAYMKGTNVRTETVDSFGANPSTKHISDTEPLRSKIVGEMA